MSDQPVNNLSGKVELDVTDYKTAVSTLNREIRVVESGFRASAAALGDWSKDASGLEMRIKTLTQTIGLQQAKVAALQGEYEKIAREKGKNSKAAQDLQIRINKETEALNKNQAELVSSKTALDGMGKEAEDGAKQVGKLAKAEDDAADKSNRLSGVMNGLGGALKIGAAAVAGLATVLVGAAVGLGKMVFDATETAGALVDLSLQTGISVERLQELEYIGGQVGVSTDTMTGAMAKLVRTMAGGSDAFKTLGVSVTDANGDLRDNEDVFNDVIAALGKVENETERDALAMEIFGKSAQELNPLIKAGTDELNRLSQQAHDVGAVMGDDGVFALEAFGDELASLKASFKGVLGTLAAAVLPVFRELVSWVKANLPVLVDWLKVQVPAAIQVLADYWSTVLLPAIQAAWSWIDANLVPLVQSLIAWLGQNLPVAIQALSKFWGEVLLPAIQTAWAWISGTLLPFLGQLAGELSQTVGGAVTTLADYWTGTLQPALQTVWDFLNTSIFPLMQALGTLLSVTLGLAVQVLAGLWSNTLKPALEAVWKFIKDSLQPVLQTLADFWEDTLGPAIERVKDNVLEKLPAIFDAIKKAIQWVIEKLRGFTNALAGVQLPSWLGGGGGGGAPPNASSTSSAGFAASGFTINITVNGNGDPAQIGSAAQAGVLRALRAAGVR